METAQTADYALQVLLLLEAEGDQSLNDIAGRLDLSRRVTHRVMATLHQGAMVTRDARGSYALGPALIALASNLPHKLVSAAEPTLRRLADVTGEMAILTIPDGDDAVLVDHRGSETGQLRVEFATGFRHSLTVGASGLAILASLPADKRGDHTPAMATELATILARGYARSSGELSAYTTGIAAPIFDGRGMVVGSVGIVASISRSDALVGTPRDSESQSGASRDSESQSSAVEQILEAARAIGEAYDAGSAARPRELNAVNQT